MRHRRRVFSSAKILEQSMRARNQEGIGLHRLVSPITTNIYSVPSPVNCPKILNSYTNFHLVFTMAGRVSLYAKEDRAVEHPRERQQEWS